MSDIVERLKQREAWWGKLHDYVIAKRGEAIGTEWFGRFNAIAHSIRGRLPVEAEAADTITTLRATISRLKGEKSKLRDKLSEAVELANQLNLLPSGERMVERWETAIAETGEKP